MSIRIELQSKLEDPELISKVIDLADLYNYNEVVVSKENMIKVLTADPRLQMKSTTDVMGAIKRIADKDKSYIDLIVKFVDHFYTDLARQICLEYVHVNGHFFGLWTNASTLKSWILLNKEITKYCANNPKVIIHGSNFRYSNIMRELYTLNEYSTHDSHFEINKMLVDYIKTDYIAIDELLNNGFIGLIELYCSNDNYLSLKYFNDNFIKKIKDSTAISTTLYICLSQNYYAFIEKVILDETNSLQFEIDIRSHCIELVSIESAMYFIDLYQSDRIVLTEKSIKRLLYYNKDSGDILKVLAIIFPVEVADSYLGKVSKKYNKIHKKLLKKLIK